MMRHAMPSRWAPGIAKVAPLDWMGSLQNDGLAVDIQLQDHLNGHTLLGGK